MGKLSLIRSLKQASILLKKITRCRSSLSLSSNAILFTVLHSLILVVTASTPLLDFVTNVDASSENTRKTIMSLETMQNLQGNQFDNKKLDSKKNILMKDQPTLKLEGLQEVSFLDAVTAKSSTAKTRIVFLKGHGYLHHARTNDAMNTPEGREGFKKSLNDKHRRILRESLGWEAISKKFYDYHHLVPGFAAVLTDEEVEALEEHDEVRMVDSEKVYQPHTTHSGKFLGLSAQKGLWSRTNGSNVIIGVLDTGVWPEGPSFSDSNYGPIPSKWKGTCQTGEGWTKSHCNKKLIGARWFNTGYAMRTGTDPKAPPEHCQEFLSARDAIGHGSYTASIAGGSRVQKAVVDDYNLGTVKGMAFGARLAIYKVCWCNAGGPASPNTFCGSSDIMAAFDAAVQDGVDVLSISLGSGPAVPGDAYLNHMSYMSLYAVLHGIPTVFSAGNDGAIPGSSLQRSFTVANAAPWQYTVAASTTDRVFVNGVTLGNGVKLKGSALVNKGTPAGKSYPLIEGTAAALDPTNPIPATNCRAGALNPELVAGKIVVCRRGGIPTIDLKGLNVLEAGGVGMIAYNTEVNGESLIQFAHYLPASNVGEAAGKQLLEYVRNTQNPVGSITPSVESAGPSVLEAPLMRPDSSIGPNGLSFNILKPDIAAPGFQIIGAWSGSEKTDGESTTSWLPFQQPALFNFLYSGGTSVAAPHVAGTIALLKYLRPTWPPSYFYSAITTSGYQRTNRGRVMPPPIEDETTNKSRSSPFNFGGGQLTPNKAADPGLVYGIQPADYNTFLCSPEGGFQKPATQIRDKYCEGETRALDLNLPSISFFNVTKPVTTSRTLTLVGRPAVYSLRLRHPAGCKLVTSLRKIKFRTVGQSIKYTVTVNPIFPTAKASVTAYKVTTNPLQVEERPSVQQKSAWTFGEITWVDSLGHYVRLMVAVNIP